MASSSHNPYLDTTLRIFCHLENQWADSPKIRPITALAMLVSGVATPIFLIYDALHHLYQRFLGKTSLGDHHYFYSSPIFDAYLQGLQEHIRKEVKQDPSLKNQKIVQWIQKPGSPRMTFHRGFVSRLREEVRSNPSSLFIQRLCHWVFTGSNLLPEMNVWMRNEAKHFKMDQGFFSLKEFYIKLSEKSFFQGEVFPDYRPYDPLYLGDTPTALYNLGKTKVIRTPAVTHDEERSWLGRLRKAAIVPEFTGYLEHCKTNRQTHLYINLMAQTGSERVRSKALEELEIKKSAVFQLVTLSKDSPFYHQKGSFSKLDHAEEFKEEFLNQMFSKNNPDYHWPINWDRAKTQAICKSAIEKVHSNHFGSRKSLTRHERETFIELSYTEIIESLIGHHQPAACNISCRSCIDRGAANLTLLYAQTQPSQEALATVALAPAILAQGRTMLKGRLERLIPPLVEIQKRRG